MNIVIKEVEQQDIQSLHRIRSRVVANRTAQISQIRGLLMEYGIDIPRGRAKVRHRLPQILENAENSLTMQFRGWLYDLYTYRTNASQLTLMFLRYCACRINGC